MSRKLQYQIADGSWTDATDRDGSDRTDEFVNKAAAFSRRSAADVLATLETGKSVTYADYVWYAKIRLTPAPRAARLAVAHAFTCTHCGSHRDTTIAGQCDDCEANR